MRLTIIAGLIMGASLAIHSLLGARARASVVHAAEVHGVSQLHGEFSQTLHLVIARKDTRDITEDSVDLEGEVMGHDRYRLGLGLEFCFGLFGL